MTAVRIYMHKGFMRTKLRSLFSEHADAIGIEDYRENKDSISTNIWMECSKDDIEWFLNKFKEEYSSLYDDEDQLKIKIFKEGCYLVEQQTLINGEGE